jgi:hypothetical protein
MNIPHKTVLLLIVLLMLNFCGGRGDETVIEKAPKTETVEPSEDPVSDEEEETYEEDYVDEIKPPIIKNVKFPEAPSAGKDFKVEVELEEQDLEVVVNYRWFVNSLEITDATEETLSMDYFSGNDWIQCWVTAQKGDKTSRLKKSKFIRAKGAIPVVKVTKLEELRIPGTVKYKIDAYDPSIGENIETEDSAMKYHLLAPLEAGIQLNQDTGELSWELDEETINKLGAKIEIKFKVSSKQSQVVTSSIVLNFKKESEAKKTEDQEQQENRSESF